jgi:hypothetical protein
MSVSRWPAQASASGLILAALLGILPGATRGDDVPDTDKWTVVISDKFEREKVGERWKVVFGNWTIEDGALKGRLSKKDLPGYEYHEADIALNGTEIPSTVEVRYETWSPDEVGSETKFLTEAGDGGIVMACLGVIHPAYGAKGTMAFVFKEKGYRSVGSAQNATLAPKVRHKVRLVRKEDQATFFLDGKEVLSADVSDAKGLRDLNLHLVGTWGREGSVVYFDNLEVRIPSNQNK